ncbi:hypothetical protein PCASD_13363, partial [Puccinia coronata f. sp. avenae]
LFAFSQLCTNFWWAMLSDRVGRKPILLSGLTGLAISMISLSLQTSFAGMVVARCVAGVMNEIRHSTMQSPAKTHHSLLHHHPLEITHQKSVLAEITDDTNKARVEHSAVGIIVGPLIGGYLAKPASQYPDYFGYVQFLVDYPYFLPCFIAGMINLFAVTIGFFFLEETLASKKTHNNLSLSDQGNEHDIQEDVEPEEAAQNVPQPKPRFVELFTPSIISVLFSSLLVFFQMSSLATLIPLFAYTRFEDGGLGLNLRQMGTALTTNGFAAVVVQTVTFPYLQRRWGTVKVFRTVLLISPIVFVLLPVVHSLVQARRDASGVDAGARMAMVASWSFCLTLLVNSAAPSASTFGTLNGLAQSTADLARTFAPFMTGAVFSMSIDQQYLHGNLVWVCGLLVTLVLTLFFAHTTTIIHPPRIPKTRHNLPSSSHV